MTATAPASVDRTSAIGTHRTSTYDPQLVREREYHARMRAIGDRSFQARLVEDPQRCPSCGSLIVRLSQGQGRKKLVCDALLEDGTWKPGQRLAVVYTPRDNGKRAGPDQIALWPTDSGPQTIPSTVEGRPLHVCSPNS